MSVADTIFVVGPQAAVFDVEQQQWASVATPLTPRYWLGAAANQGRVVAIGGYAAGGVGSSAAVEVYDPAADRWSSDGTLHVPVAQMGAVSSCSRIFLFGGDANGQIVDTVQVFDGARWSSSR